MFSFYSIKFFLFMQLFCFLNSQVHSNFHSTKKSFRAIFYRKPISIDSYKA